ncbi:MAG: MmcQ/YjbR family DNA-binding protein [Acidimicrobiaceae bacterium]|nr:MmcQ/YjbR family DNA-binding protein [Acidimicrobiaceae bacterium]MYC42469.1 MmcQ/YjbR family DNA-binding protein [Acidimicrobiaceae bacterium]
MATRVRRGRRCDTRTQFADFAHRKYHMFAVWVPRHSFRQTGTMDMVSEIRRIALALPEATEETTWDDINFRVRKKIFCFPGETAMTVKADPEELEALLHDPRFELARYVGRFGWVSMTFGDTADLAELRELILTSYLLIAPKSLGRQALAEHQDKTSRETSG